MHTVYLDGFWTDRIEVTNAQYQQCVEAGVYQAPMTCYWGEPTYEDASQLGPPGGVRGLVRSTNLLRMGRRAAAHRSRVGSRDTSTRGAMSLIAREATLMTKPR